MKSTSPKTDAKYIRKPLSQPEYSQLSDLVYSLILGQETAARGEEKALWATPHGQCVNVAVLTAAILFKHYKKRFRKLHIRKVMYCANLLHPDIPTGSPITFFAGNPADLAQGLPPEVAALLPDYPGQFHVAVILEDTRRQKWLIDPAGASDAFHASLVSGDITKRHPASEYALGVCHASHAAGILRVLAIDDVSPAVKDYIYRPLTGDLAETAAFWHRMPGEPMAGVDERGCQSIIPWQESAFWVNASIEVPDNITVMYSTEEPPE